MLALALVIVMIDKIFVPPPRVVPGARSIHYSKNSGVSQPGVVDIETVSERLVDYLLPQTNGVV
jgi:hypothetical protein